MKPEPVIGAEYRLRAKPGTVFRIVEVDERCIVLRSETAGSIVRKVFSRDEFGTDAFSREFVAVEPPKPVQGLDMRDLITLSSTLHRALGMIELGLATSFADDELFARFNALRSACLDTGDMIDARIQTAVGGAK